MIRVKITKVPKARTGYQVRGSLANDVPAMGGADYNAYIGMPQAEVSKYISRVPRDEANLEAEGGETVFGDLNGDGMPEHKIIKGPRHAQGGVPLNLPDDTFIFSDFRGMRLKDPEILQMFGKAVKKGSKSFTPAELAKQYDINKYRKILQDPNSDAIDRKTAELMIKKFNIKLGMLALAQEAKKGFPQGIPVVAIPAMEAYGITEEDLLPKTITNAIEDVEKQKQMQQGEDIETLESENQEQPEQGYENAQEINQGQPVAQPMEEMQQPSQEEMMRYGGYRRLRKARQGMMQEESYGMSEDPCPKGMVYDPIYGCIEVQEQQIKEYAPEQINQYFDKWGRSSQPFYEIKENSDPEYWNSPKSDFFIKMLQDNKIPYNETAPGQYSIPDKDLTPEQKMQLNYLNENYTEKKLNILNQLGVPPSQWMNYIQNMELEEGSNPFNSTKENEKFDELYRQMDDEYEQNLENCPCRQKEVVNNTIQEICVPCEEMSMAQYGMSMGGYDVPFYDMPQAEYGMAMGANPQNYQGRRRDIPASGPMYARGGGLRKAQNGLEVDVTGLSEADKNRKIYFEQKKNPGKDIIIVSNGKKQKLKSSTKAAPSDVTGLDMSKWGSGPDAIAAAASYKLIEESLKDPKVQEKLYAETIASLKNPLSYQSKTGNQGQTWEQRGLALPSKEQVAESFRKFQERNLMIKANGVDSKLYTDAGRNFDTDATIIKRGARHPETGKVITTAAEAQSAKNYLLNTYGPQANKLSTIAGKLGVPFDESGNDRALQQATFHGYTRMIENQVNYDEDAQYALKNFIGNLQSGVNDESSMSGLFKTKGLEISPIDDFRPIDKSYYGNTTAQELASIGLDKYEFEDLPGEPDPNCQCDDPSKENYGKYKDANGNCSCTPPNVETKKCPCQKTDGTVIDVGSDPNTGECNPCEEDVPYDVAQPAEWWLQDTIKTTGAFGDLMGVKKYMPWAPKVDLETPRPTFLDPTRDLAANAEQANIQTAGMAQFAGPQAMSARSSSIQGQASKNAADTLSRFNNANVNLANQFEFKANDIRNQEQMLNQAAASKLYDQNTIANQQYDNARLAMRNNLRNYYTNAITNRWKTDALNQMFPQYAVSPAVGGQMYFTEGKAAGFKPQEMNTGSDYWAQRKKCIDEGAKDPDACARNAVSASKNIASSSEYDDRMTAMQNQYPGNAPGVQQRGGFVYSELFTPFLL